MSAPQNLVDAQRLDGEAMRRAEAAGVVPDRTAPGRPVSAILREEDDDRPSGRSPRGAGERRRHEGWFRRQPRWRERLTTALPEITSAAARDAASSDATGASD